MREIDYWFTEAVYLLGLENAHMKACRFGRCVHRQSFRKSGHPGPGCSHRVSGFSTARERHFSPSAILATLLVCLCHQSLQAAETPLGATELARKVDPAIVTIVVPDIGYGSGFVLGKTGEIVTNYHVIEGAKKASVMFHDKSTAQVEGFLAISPGKDLAILRVKPPHSTLGGLQTAKSRPSKGANVFAFGAPLGLTGTVSDGIVSAVRSGIDIRDVLKKMLQRDVYVDILHYDLDAIWIQTTAPISRGNSGGPLVDERGDVVGVNTASNTLGQNLNFAVSSHHLKHLLENAGETLRPLSDLPKPRSGLRRAQLADGKRTLEYWIQRTKAEQEALSSPMRRLRPPGRSAGPRAAARAINDVASMMLAYADRISRLDAHEVDEELVAAVLEEARTSRKGARAWQGIAAALNSYSKLEFVKAQAEMRAYDKANDEVYFATFSKLRVTLSKKYGLEFPDYLPKDAAKPDAPELTAEERAAKEASSKLVIAKNLIEAGKRDAAKSWLRKVITKYPGTEAAKEAQALLNGLE